MKKRFKYFIGYVSKSYDHITPFYITQIKWINKKFCKSKVCVIYAWGKHKDTIIIKHGNYKRNYNQTWNDIKDLIGKNFDTEIIFDDNYVTTKMKSYESKIKIYFHYDGLPQ